MVRTRTPAALGASPPWTASSEDGSAPLALLLWLTAGLLFVAPFLREPDGLPGEEGDWGRELSESDTPFFQDLANVEEDLGLVLAGPIAEAGEERFGLGSDALAESGLFEVRRLEPGRRAYDLHCVGCHGASGDGGGPAARYLEPRPRNFRKGAFKFTSTETGGRPLRRDLFGTITRGLSGSSMPAFSLLSEETRLDLVEWVRYAAMRGEFEHLLLDFSWDEEELADADEAYEIVLDRWSPSALRAVYPAVTEPSADAASIERGRALYFDTGRANCAACHGSTGRGDGPSATAFLDDWGYPIQPRDLTTGVFRAGSEASDLYRSIATGINGTPMGAFGGSLEPGEIWDLVHFVQSLGRSSR